MIPEFPKFKKLELSDKNDVEEFASKFPPYSDFNFVSMWSWDIRGEMRLSVLNNNLVVRFRDYLTGKLLYSFLGKNKAAETAEILIEFSKKEGLEPRLKLIPEEVVNNLIGPNFNVAMDQDAFDYIYSVSHLSNMNNWAKHGSGKNIRSYTRSCPNYVVKHHSIKDTKMEEIIEMFRVWAKNKGEENYSKLNEYEALERIFEIKNNDVGVVSIYVDNVLVGFTIYEILSYNYAISHFAKSNIEHHCAIGDILNWEEAKILDVQGIKYFSWEQDLGIPGLRKSKEKYKPSFFLKKFIISYKDKKSKIL